MENSTWIAIVSLAVLGMVMYTFLPNRPALLGQWTMITQGHEVPVVGHDVSVTLTEARYVPPLDIDYRGYVHREFDFRVGDTTIQPSGQVVTNGAYYFRQFGIPLKKGAVIFVNVSDAERYCPKIKNASRHVGCYQRLMRHHDDVSYCFQVNTKRAPYGIAKCHWSWAYHNQDVSLCEQIPKDVPSSEHWTEQCYADLQGVAE